MIKSAVVFNLGCKVNQYECDVLATGLQNLGYNVSTELCNAELYIINTCAVTAEAERKSRQIISRVRRYNSLARIIICGCASKNNLDFYLSKGVEYVTNNSDKTKLLENLEVNGTEIVDSDPVIKESKITPIASRKRAYLKIQDGCNNFCSYCIIPYLRGRSRSRDILSIKNEALALAVNSEYIIIVGINLSHYGIDIDTTLPELISNINDIKVTIGLGSFYAEGITTELLVALKNLYAFDGHFHLSLQSGDDKILKDMNRHYTTAEYLTKIQLIREFFPSAIITTDIIVGYPTETEDGAKNSLEFVKTAKFDDIHIFPYSSRKGTVASQLQLLPTEVVTRRRLALEKIKKELQSNVLARE